ncbi:TELO2-interacting protein 1 homolog [Leptodactylus fuscus]|uniref:TELO2-interacting protein 1 homolog n=1 Tax=Leptodactylus fuscus TaxID=238119 RepID=UPI003F4E5147
MASKNIPNNSFEALRPLCVQLTSEQTVQNIRKLRSQIFTMDQSHLQELLDYILFPLRFAIRTAGPKKYGLVQAALECISYLLSRTNLKNAVSLKEMFSEFICCFPPDPRQQVPEDLKMAIVVAVQSLLQASSVEMLRELYKPAVLPEMGFLLTMALKFAECEKSRELRLESMHCMETLLFPEFRDELGGLFATFLPGISTLLLRIICGDPKQGYRVTVKAVFTWGGLVAVVMADESLAQVPKKPPVYPGLSERVAELMLHRDKSWVKNCAHRLSIQLDKIIARCSADPHWQVRMVLLEMAHILLCRCWNSFQEAAGSIMRILVSHMNDEKPEVKQKANHVLQEILTLVPVHKTLAEVLTENLHSLAVTLPRLLSSQDDQGKLQTLALVIGYLQLLGPKLQFTLQSSAHLMRLSSALIQTLELDLCSVKVVEERLPSSVKTLTQEDLAHTAVQQKTFRFFRDPRVYSHIQSVCRLLGYYGHFDLLTDHFMCLYRAQSLPAVLVLNQLVLGAAGIDVEKLDKSNHAREVGELLAAIRPLLEEYTDPVNWNLLTCQDSDDVVENLSLLRVGDPPKPAVSDMTANAWKLCLQLEGISCFAQALGHNFRPLLISSLYPVLEKAGDPSLMVSGAAMTTLNNVSQACGFKNVNHLIELNSDYLASEVSVGLRRLQNRHEGAARVLQVMLENCGPSLMPLLYELVQDLLPALDQSQNDGAKVLFPVLNSLILRLGRWYPTVSPPSTESIKSQKPESLAQEMIQFLQEHKQQHRIAQGDIEEEEAADVLPPSEEVDVDQKQPLPTHLQVTKEVAEKCTHFLSHAGTKLRIQALDTLQLSLAILNPHEDILLPLVHKLWPCLVRRLVQDKPQVLLRAFKLLVSLAASCKEFIRQRVCKDALPAFLVYLRTQANVSCHGGAVYNQTFGFKLQKALLDGLGELCADLSLGDGDLLEVIDSCALYLSSRHPKQLQEAAFSTLLRLSELDPDNVWLHLCAWQKPPEVPHSSLVPVSWTIKSHDEYTHNICKLLKKLQGL